MHTVCHVIKRLEKLAVDHAYQIIQRGVCIRDTAEKGNFSFSHVGKIQFISIGQLGNLRQIEGCQPDTYTDQDGLGGLSRDEKSRTFSSNSKRSHILRTSSRSRRLILSSIVSLAVSLKCTRTI